MMNSKETIAQIVTAPGGAVGIIRVSGPLAHTIGRALTRIAQAPLVKQVVVCAAFDAQGAALDDGLYFEFAGPHSFTGEDVCEFQGHGGSQSLQQLLARCLALGARAAQPGEFSQRAFLNGKLDLAEAEAIAELIAAQSQAAHRVAYRQLKGELSRHLTQLRAPLVTLATHIAADLEFPDEHTHSFEAAAALSHLQQALSAVAQLLGSYQSGKLLKEGAAIALYGPPNAGKSSLLNALLGYERAIVSPLAGTTRDVVEERLLFHDIPIRLLDTAGIREQGADGIETQGMERALTAVRGADVVLCVLSSDSDARAFLELQASRKEGAPHSEEAAPLPDAAPTLYILNKSDLPQQDPTLVEEITRRGGVLVSARTGEGLPLLETRLKALLLGKAPAADLPLLTLSRHATLLTQAHEALLRARDTLQAQLPHDLLLVDITIAIRRLGEVLGENVSAEVLAQIFKRFCIGK